LFNLTEMALAIFPFQVGNEALLVITPPPSPL